MSDRFATPRPQRTRATMSRWLARKFGVAYDIARMAAVVAVALTIVWAAERTGNIAVTLLAALVAIGLMMGFIVRAKVSDRLIEEDQEQP